MSKPLKTKGLNWQIVNHNYWYFAPNAVFVRDTFELTRNPSASISLSFHIGSQHGVHARQVALASGLEPLRHIAVQAEMYGGLSARHDDTRAAPECRAEGLCLRRIRTGLILALLPHRFDLAKRVSHDSRFLFHPCPLSVR